MALTVACVLNKGPGCAYDVGYVNSLRKGVEKYLSLPHRFVCLSNVEVPCERIELKYNWPVWWAKMELFRPDLDLDNTLFFDLDTIIVNDLSDIAKVKKFTVIANWINKPGKGNGSGMMFLADRSRVWNDWIAAPAKHIQECGGNGDGKFIVPYAESIWSMEVPGQVKSYKKNILPRDLIPDGTRVICFHGTPRPHEIKKPHWVHKYWQPE
jgi:hypothetical protein